LCSSFNRKEQSYISNHQKTLNTFYILILKIADILTSSGSINSSAVFSLCSLGLSKLEENDPIITQQLIDEINNDPKSTFKAKLYPQFASMKVKDVKKFLSPIRKAPEAHSSARPVGYSERSFYNSDKRYFSGIGKEIICSQSEQSDYNKKQKFSDDLQTEVYNHNNNFPKAQFACSSTENKIRYYPQYPVVGGYAEVPITVYDNTIYCSSWATASTSAMTMTLSRWSTSSVNLSIQFVLDCDILGDPCVERPAFSAYEQFWRRYIPETDKWRQVDDPLTAASSQLSKEICDNYRGCYPGQNSCKRQFVLSGVCTAGTQTYGACPVYFLYNWRWIKSHLAEVGAVTSSILVRPDLFAYDGGVYSSYGWNKASGERDEVLGMLDVTIIGWGQDKVNLTNTPNENTQMNKRWWYVIPHLGLNYGLKCSELLADIANTDSTKDVTDSFKTGTYVTSVSYRHISPTGEYDNTAVSGIKFNFGGATCGTDNLNNQARTGIMKFNRRFDDSNIESQAVGAVPFNFVPKAWRTLPPTWSNYQAP